MGSEEFYDDGRLATPSSRGLAHRTLALLEVVNEAFVMQATLAALNVLKYNDDLVATMQNFASQQLYNGAFIETLPAVVPSDAFKWHFLNEVSRVLGFHYDYCFDPQPQQMLQNGVIQHCLSTQASLGYAGMYKPPSISSMVAQTTLDLRYAAICFLGSMRSKTGPDSELKNPGLSM